VVDEQPKADPTLVDRWLDEQIRFDAACEARVIRAILRSLSALLGERFETVRDLSRFRRRGRVLPAEAAGAPAGAAT